MLSTLIREKANEGLKELYDVIFSEKEFQVNPTKPEFTGNYTIVLFSLIKTLKNSPDQLGNALGGYLLEKHPTLFITIIHPSPTRQIMPISKGSINNAFLLL